jgi:hypothetical protein
MRHLLLAGATAMAALQLCTPVPADAQNQKAPAKAGMSPRMADGHPDLQGTYFYSDICSGFVKRRICCDGAHIFFELRDWWSCSVIYSAAIFPRAALS